jgi:hypothetical protein
MPQPFNGQVDHVTEDEFIDSIGEHDFVFIVNRDGTLKTVLLPDEFELVEMPESVKELMQVFDISTFQSHTIH